MAIEKTLKSTTLAIEVASGKNSKGETTYRTKSFSNIAKDAACENVYNVAKAISEVLSMETGKVYLKDTNEIVENDNQ